MRRTIIATITLLVLFVSLPASPAGAAPCATGTVTFASTDVISMTGTTADKGALIKVVADSWRRYLDMDVPGYKGHLATDVTKMSGRWGANGLQQGADAVAAALPVEFTAYEQTGGAIAENFTIRRAELWSGGTAATALYWVSVKGGARWCYTDLGLVMQAFVKSGSGWKLAHQTDSWNLSVKYAKGLPGKPTFPFDWVVPVKNLTAEVNFYERFAGEPEFVTATEASFNLKGARFILDAGKLGGLAQVTSGKPNGLAMLPVDDVAAERDRLKAAGVKFLANTGTTLLNDGPDRYAVPLDPSGNPFVIVERNYSGGGTGVPAAPTGFTGTDARITAAKDIATKWLRTDGAGLQTLYGSAGRWFDDTRSHIRGLEKGSSLATVLPAEYWSGYDRTNGGLQATMGVSSVRTRSLGTGRSIESHLMTLTGNGAHPYRDTAFVTHLFNGSNKPLVSMTVLAEIRNGGALSLDYSGYPVTDLAAAESFYTDVMGMGKAYPDSGYRGWWADSGVVFGIYIAKPSRDGLPRPNLPSGYMSFWVSSAKQTYDALKAQGATFPLIPAINDVKGIDPQPGYTQVVATDPDGNVQVFTEYTGD